MIANALCLTSQIISNIAQLFTLQKCLQNPLNLSTAHRLLHRYRPRAVLAVYAIFITDSLVFNF